MGVIAGPNDLQMTEPGVDRRLPHVEEDPLDETASEGQRDYPEGNRRYAEETAPILARYVAERI